VNTRISIEELQSRMARFRQRMQQTDPNWEIAVIVSKINLFYFTGTMQEGILIIPRDDEVVLYVRRSYERALDETVFPNIKAMNSFKDAAADFSRLPDTVYMETEVIPLAYFERFRKHFPFKTVLPVDSQIAAVRAVKSKYELSLIRQAGNIHRRVLEELLPDMLEEGISEIELAGRLYAALLDEGHHGVARFGMFDTEVSLGHIAFGENSIYPTNFNGPGGNMGMSPAIPMPGNRERRLRKSDLVFIDVACGVDGYHTDKTMTYVFGGSLPDEAVALHRQCVDIQDELARQLKPGAIPSDIYKNIMQQLPEGFLENFMGFASRRVKFLGHGIGLVVDEWPVIAEGFNEPLQENMVFALEPKKGIKGIGMVGIENTFLVTPDGGQCLTGTHPGLIHV
jgi:Xaa-Pro dipeptidase